MPADTAIDTLTIDDPIILLSEINNTVTTAGQKYNNTIRRHRMDDKYIESIRKALGTVVVPKRSKIVTRIESNGVIVVSDKEGRELARYTIPEYRSPTSQELQAMEEERVGNIVLAEKLVDKLYPNIREAARRLSAIDDTDVGEKMLARSDYLRLMREMQEANAAYSQAVYPEKFINSVKGIPTNRLFIDKRMDDSVIQHPINFLKSRPFPLEKIMEREGKVILPAEPASTTVTEEIEEFIPINSEFWLNPDAPINFEYDGAQYISIRQAIEAWKAREGGNPVAESIMGAASSREATAIATKGGLANKEIPVEIIKAIILASIKNNKPRQTVLKNMREGVYIYLNMDRVLGIGRLGPLEEIETRGDWNGQNLFGLAFAEVIKELKIAAVTARTGAIIGRRIASKKANFSNFAKF